MKLLGLCGTDCQFGSYIVKIIINTAKLSLGLLVILYLIFSVLFSYWLFFDNAPAIRYGPNGRAEFIDDRIIFHIDATRLRGCETEIRRKITGCGQIDLPLSFSTTTVGSKAGPISLPLTVLFQSFSQKQLSGNVCSLVSQAESYCNPAQKMLRMPIIVQSSPISFIPVPRSKSYSEIMPP